MDRSLQKRGSKQAKSRKKQQPPLKVVYITNPIKFKTSASEFRALVQELTGQDADIPVAKAAAAAVAVEVEEEDNSNNVDAVEEVMTKVVGQTTTTCDGDQYHQVVGNGSDPSTAFGSYFHDDDDDGDDYGFYNPQMWHEDIEAANSHHFHDAPM
ncbi:UNVERIFIED_CONTAM: hypothetical protein Slati_1299000 [Sesamum latifolium]|uniref:VQ domain-containing protein n=1 Tax=Sesamum latifolium TaxID=2727402 RepID=A0AAW2XJA6_9LAMI